MGPGCKLSLVTETERWVEIDPADWEEGGKYFCVRGKVHARTDASKHVASARNKRKRGAAIQAQPQRSHLLSHECR